MASQNAASVKKKVVQYSQRHSFSIREITAEQWAGVNAAGQETTVWSMDNEWAIPVEKFSKEALEYIDRDPDLFVVDA